MKLRIIVLLILSGMFTFQLSGCSGGGGTTTTPDNGIPNPGDVGNAGDPDENQPPGTPLNPFVPPSGQYGDVRGVSASREFVYVADDAILYCFDKRGNFKNQVAAPDVIQGVSVFPPVLAEEVQTVGGYLLANCPVIVHNPVAGYGYVTVYAPGLDPASTREDVAGPDPVRLMALPWGDEDINPPVTNPLPTWNCVRTYDVKVDRYGSILVMMDLEINPPTAPLPDYPRTLQIFSNFEFSGLTGRQYHIQSGGSFTFNDQQTNQPITRPLLGLHRSGGAAQTNDVAVGDFDFDGILPDIDPFDWVNLGKFAVDTLSPAQLASSARGYNFAVGSANFTRDYVGLARMDLTTEGVIAPAVAAYDLEPEANNEFGYNQIIGDLPGPAPGSFSPEGSPDDPDLTQGGPSGMCFDPRPDHNRDLYVCDPGNSRVQLFRSEGQSGPWRLVDIITQDASNQPLIAPSSVAVDTDGNVFIGDITTLRRVIRKPIENTFGTIGGTVRNGVLNVPLAGATISLHSADGFSVIETETSNIKGQYRFENLPVGDYFLQASKFNYTTDIPVLPLRVLADQTIIADFNLFPPTSDNFGIYVGNVRDHDTHRPIAGITVRLLGTGLESITDPTGHFEIGNIPPGTYQALFNDPTQPPSYQAIVRDLAITSGQTTSDNFVELFPVL